MNYLDDKDFKGSVTYTLAYVISNNVKDKEQTDHIFQTIYDYWILIKSIPSGANRAKELHKIMDVIISDVNMNQTTCRTGCSHCCKMEALVTDDEGILLVKKIKEGLKIDRELLKFQSKLKDKDAWKKVPEEKRRCVFLGQDDKCRVYEDRPLSCRKHYVISPPQQCADIHGNSHVFSINQAEMLVSAAYNLKPEVKSISKMLLSKLGE